MNPPGPAGDRDPDCAQEALIPIAEALEGMKVVGLPDDMRWVGAFMLIKTKDDQGGGGWSSRRTEGLSDEELLGVLAVHTEMLRDRIRYRGEE